ncbi:MAG: M50 family metallopeptidase [Planctomycetes bacterium]|nr:M50 family metallopeptidase [Planctomycetota bacterium]
MSADSSFLQDLGRRLGETAWSTLWILGVLGLPALACCIVLHALAWWQSRRLVEAFGWRGLLLTGWLGVPVHELSHAVAALLFGHEIREIRLFKPDPSTGQLGYVDHSYNPRNPYAAILGNAVIPMAPFFGGAVAIVLLTLLIQPQLAPPGRPADGAIAPTPASALGDPAYYGPLLEQTWSSLSRAAEAIRAHALWRKWSFYAYLYAVFCVAMHLAPSRTDFKNFWTPALVVFLLLFLANFTARLVRDVTGPVIGYLWPAMLAITGLLSFATVVSLAGSACVTLLTLLLGKRAD